MDNKKNQNLPIVLAFIVLFVVCLFYFGFIQFLNLFPGEKIVNAINVSDVLFGLTIYLKTSVDFALLIGLLMKQYPGTKNRIAIETGTALGNTLGTVLVLFLWYFFKEIKWLLALMVFFASLVLLKLAETSIEHIEDVEKEGTEVNQNTKAAADFLSRLLRPINKITSPFLSKIVPEMSFKNNVNLSFWGLITVSFTIPFILGTDDFAGYVPLFRVVNVFGFGIGVFLGHTLLNVFLFINPLKTIQIVKNPIIGIIGSIVFIGLSIWGFKEALHLISEYLPNLLGH